MTTQVDDSVKFEGRTYASDDLPLSFLPAGQMPDDLIVPNTGCWRGYVAQWEIDESRLWLTGINAERFDKASGQQLRVGIADIFPGTTGRVPAEWYSGTISLPHGELLPPERQLMFASPSYTHAIRLQIEHGFVQQVDRVERARQGR